MSALRVRDILVFRHGETDWNAEGRVQGSRDRPLTARGRAEAEAIGRGLAGLLSRTGREAADFDCVTSPLGRARETARLAGLYFGAPETLWRPEPALAELAFGRWEGLTPDEIKARFRAERDRRRADRWHVAPEGGESFATLAARIAGWMEDRERPTIACAHAFVIRAMAHAAGAVSRADAPTWAVPHGTLFRIDADGFRTVDF